MDHHPDSLVTPGETHAVLIRVERSLNEHRSETKEELAGIREHLAALNGKVNTNTIAIAEHRLYLQTHEREIAKLAARPSDPPPLPPELTEMIATLKGVKILRGMIVGLWAVGLAIAGLIWWIVTHVRFGP